MFREIARRVPWLGDAGAWKFDCVEFSKQDHMKTNGSCLISMGGLFAANPYDTDGIKSSQSTAEAGAYTLHTRAGSVSCVHATLSTIHAAARPTALDPAEAAAPP